MQLISLNSDADNPDNYYIQTKFTGAWSSSKSFYERALRLPADNFPIQQLTSPQYNTD